MGRSFVLGLSVAAAGLLPTLGALADHAPVASVMVRAWGTSGSVEPIGRVDKLAPEVKAGTIPRAVLNAELARGPGRFLQQVRTKAVLSHRRFVGWQITSLFASRTDVKVRVLQPGDVVLRVNGESIERPEAFKAVWDSLSDAKELVLEIERDGTASTLRYAISG